GIDVDAEVTDARAPGPGARTALGVAAPIGAERVVPAALLGVAQDLVRLVDLLEPLGGGLVPRVHVRMVLAGQPPVGLLDGLGVRALPDAENFVVSLVGARHARVPPGL